MGTIITNAKICIALNRAHSALGTVRVDAQDAMTIERVRNDLALINEIVSALIVEEKDDAGDLKFGIDPNDSQEG